jgi:hypothetical protein
LDCRLNVVTDISKIGKKWKRINLYKKIFITFMSLAMLFSVCVPPSNAISLRQIEHKRRIARIKIFHLKKLERQEKSKLVRNQQQLEDTQDNLEASQNRYSTLTGQLNGLSSQLAYSVADYNQSNINMRRRLRHVYKSQRRGMLEMLLSVKRFEFNVRCNLF